MEGTGTMTKSASMGCLSSSSASPSGGTLGDHHYRTVAAAAAPAPGYASDDAARASCSSNCRSERKKGLPFPFNMQPMDEAPNQEEHLLRHSPNELESTTQLPTLHLGLQGPEPTAELSTTKHAAQLIDCIPLRHNNHPVPMLPTFYPTFLPVPAPFWPSNQITTAKEETMRETHKIVMPTPVVPKEPVNADEVVSMSKLSIGEDLRHHREPATLSLTPRGTSSSSRQSAFHIDSSMAVPDLNQTNSSPIHAV
ncbi:hypothetical protein BHM03_00061831 [Ensete ventricosum]|nr:hypothetical protein BHM03_00061831 [Ensete ventricosum]